MWLQILGGSILLGICCLLHVGILVLAIRILGWVGESLIAFRKFPHHTILLCTALVLIVASHTVQIWIWAVSLAILEAGLSLGDAVYFSLVTYTTLGYGDLTLSGGNRTFGAMAAVTGLLNFGLSTAFFVSLFSKLLANGR